MIDLSQDSRFSGRDFNPGPPEYEAGVLATIRSVYMYICMYLYVRVYICMYVCIYVYRLTYVRLCM
jgi:hypothetical protein